MFSAVAEIDPHGFGNETFEAASEMQVSDSDTLEVLTLLAQVGNDNARRS